MDERKRRGEKEGGRGAFRPDMKLRDGERHACRVSATWHPYRPPSPPLTGVQKALKTKSSTPSNSLACDSACLHPRLCRVRVARDARLLSLFTTGPRIRLLFPALPLRLSRVNACKDGTGGEFHIPSMDRARAGGIFFEHFRPSRGGEPAWMGRG